MRYNYRIVKTDHTTGQITKTFTGTKSEAYRIARAMTSENVGDIEVAVIKPGGITNPNGTILAVHRGGPKPKLSHINS